jgi:hypothetical protein
MDYQFSWNAKFAATEEKRAHKTILKQLNELDFSCSCGSAQVAVYGSAGSPQLFTVFIHCRCGKSASQQFTGSL